MEVKNSKLYADIEFNQYLAMPGYSYSTIKNDGVIIEPTVKTTLGTQVHNYLGNPKEYAYDNAAHVHALAAKLKNSLGDVYRHLKKELCVTADFVHEGLVMPYKGRLDSSIPGRLVIDYKIYSGSSIRNTIRYFGYDKQVSGYASGANCRTGLIIGINQKTFATEIININICQLWWEQQVIKRGSI